VQVAIEKKRHGQTRKKEQLDKPKGAVCGDRHPVECGLELVQLDGEEGGRKEGGTNLLKPQLGIEHGRFPVDDLSLERSLWRSRRKMGRRRKEFEGTREK
jgi:hypothetical protein